MNPRMKWITPNTPVRVFKRPLDQLSLADFCTALGCTPSTTIRDIGASALVRGIKHLGQWYHGTPDNNHTWRNVYGPFTSEAKAWEDIERRYFNG